MSDSTSGEVLVHFVRTDPYRDTALATRASRILGADEHVALQRLGSAAARRDYLGAHVLVRSMIADLIGADPARLRFRATPWGRPELVAPARTPRLRFSLSHADGVALCAVVAGRAVGADVESLHAVGPDPSAVAAAVCSESEIEMLRAAPPGALAERFLHLWTQKEALAKALGLGFRHPFATLMAVPGIRWRVVSLRVLPHHVASVAVLSSPGTDVAIRLAETGCFDPSSGTVTRTIPS